MPERDPAALAFFETRLSASAKLFSAPVPNQAELEEILRLSLRVPDHGKLQPWRLIVLQGDDFKQLAEMAEAHARALNEPDERIEKARGQYDRGQLAVVVVASPKPSDKIPTAEQIYSAGALCMNLVSVATAAGWGANWLSGWVSHDREFRAKAFGCAPHEEIAGIIHIATPKHAPADRPRPDVATVVQWGL